MNVCLAFKYLRDFLLLCSFIIVYDIAVRTRSPSSMQISHNLRLNVKGVCNERTKQQCENSLSQPWIRNRRCRKWKVYSHDQGNIGKTILLCKSQWTSPVSPVKNTKVLKIFTNKPKKKFFCIIKCSNNEYISNIQNQILCQP